MAMPRYIIQVQESGLLNNGCPQHIWKQIASGSTAWEFESREKAERAKAWLYPKDPPWVRVAQR